MGWMPFSRSSAAASADDGKTIEAAAASTSTKTIAAAELPAKELKTSNLKAKAVEKPTLTEAEQLDLLVGGARLDDTAAKDKASFLGSNTRHMYLDAFLSCAVYTFSGLQHIQGQSNALTLLTMWTVGTTFLVDAGERKFLQEALQGTLPNMQKAMNGDASTGQGQQTPTAQSVDGSTANASGVQNAESVTLSSAMAAAPLDAAKLAEQQRKIFMTPTVASWVWMLASFQQFKVHKRLKWCGYSSWMGLGCVSYYTTRHMYNLLVE